MYIDFVCILKMLLLTDAVQLRTQPGGGRQRSAPCAPVILPKRLKIEHQNHSIFPYCPQYSSARGPEAADKKRASVAIASVLLKIFFQINNVSLCKTVRSVQNANFFV